MGCHSPGQSTCCNVRVSNMWYFVPVDIYPPREVQKMLQSAKTSCLSAIPSTRSNALPWYQWTFILQERYKKCYNLQKPAAFQLFHPQDQMPFLETDWIKVMHMQEKFRCKIAEGRSYRDRFQNRNGFKKRVPVTDEEEDQRCIPQQLHPVPILLPPVLSMLSLW